MSKRLIKILAISLICIMIPAAIVVSVVCVAAAQTYELVFKTLGVEANVGSITYKVDNEVVEEKTQIKKDAEITISAEAEGYNFIGWFNSKDEAISEEAVYTFKMEDNLEITAKFDIVKYNITYKTDAESVYASENDVKYGSNLLVLPEMKAGEGLAFAGWKKGADATVYSKAKFGKETNVELLASFEEIKYMISYNGAEAVEVAWGEELTAGSNDIDNGNLFENWKYGEKACTIEEGKEVAKFGAVKEIINLVPQYSKIMYNVSFDGVDAAEAIEWGTDLVAGPEITGYNFLGWQVNGNGTVLNKAIFGYNSEDPEAVIALVSKYEIKKFTITWVVEGTTTNNQVEYNTLPVYNGTPEKAGDAQYTYTFDKWTPEVVVATADATYTATFTTTVNKYTVLWVVEGSTVETDTEVEYGATPVYDGTEPEKAATAEYTYSFKGWTPAVAGITGDTTYTAEFNSVKNKYNILWVVEGSTVETDADVEYGMMPEYNSATPTKTHAEATKIWVFTGWTPAIAEVVGNTTYTAVFEEVNLYENTFTKITFKFIAADWADVNGKTEIFVYDSNIYDAEKNLTSPTDVVLVNSIDGTETIYGDFSEVAFFGKDALENLQSINEKINPTTYNQYNIQGIGFAYSGKTALIPLNADATVGDVIALAMNAGAITAENYGKDIILTISLVYAA